jgi:hypothetical protein
MLLGTTREAHIRTLASSDARPADPPTRRPGSTTASAARRSAKGHALRDLSRSKYLAPTPGTPTRSRRPWKRLSARRPDNPTKPTCPATAASGTATPDETARRWTDFRQPRSRGRAGSQPRHARQMAHQLAIHVQGSFGGACLGIELQYHWALNRRPARTQLPRQPGQPTAGTTQQLGSCPPNPGSAWARIQPTRIHIVPPPTPSFGRAGPESIKDFVVGDRCHRAHGAGPAPHVGGSDQRTRDACPRAETNWLPPAGCAASAARS